MRDLTEEESKVLVSDKIADYSNVISLFVPLTGDQPVIMYTSTSKGIPAKQCLSVGIKRKYSGGLYVYSPTKPFDINEHEFGDLDLSACKDDGSDDLQIYVSADGYDVSATVYKQDVIAMAKALGVTVEDLKLGECNV